MKKYNKDKKGLKKKLIQFLFGIGRKCRLLAYPITFLVITFLAVYHALRKIFVETQYRKLRMGVLGGLCAAIIVGAVVVLPTLASETEEEPTTEIVTEEELQPTMTPETTVEPIETEEVITPEPSKEPEEVKEPEVDEEKSEEEKEEKEDISPTSTPEMAASQEESEKDTKPLQREDVKRTPKPRRAERAAPVKLEKPTYEVIADATGVHTYPLSNTMKIGIKASAPAGAGVEYQWYLSTTADGEGEALHGNGALTSTYTIPKDSNAGNYYYYCRIKSVDNDGYNLASDEVRTSNIVVTIGKGEPSLQDFDTSAIKDKYYYTGEYIDPPIVSNREGMGKAYIVVKDGENENRPKAESEEAYPIYLHISEGSNYKAKTIDLNKSIMISRITAPKTPYTIKGTKGKLVDGKQWYKSAVSIVPASGFTISTSEDNFQSDLSYTEDGINQGPNKSVIYLRNKSNMAITSAVTVKEKRDGEINIDKTAPEVSITYNQDDFVGNATKETVVFQLTASDATSGVAKRYFYKSKEKLTDTQLKGVSWKEWVEGEDVTESKDGFLFLYAKVEDVAGNVSYASTEQLMIDHTLPVITCNGKQLGDEKVYVADKKNIIVSDNYLHRVFVTRNGETSDDISGDDIVEGSAQLTLNGPSDMSEKVVYVITAEDMAGNQKVTTVTLKNPVLDVDAVDLDFGSEENSLIYGYEAVQPQPVTLKIKGTEQQVSVNALEIEAGDAFEVVPGTNTVRPKQALHVGTYQAVLRIQYNDENESTTTCRCTVTVKPARMLVRYTGQQDVGYHTYPDLEGTIEFNKTDFKNGDTEETLKADSNFVMPSLYYQDEEGNRKEFTEDMRAMQTMQLIPGDGQATDYIFEYGGGELEVQRHSLRRGYVITGESVDGYDWYVSPTVAIRPAEGYDISRTDEVNSFASAEQLITVNGPSLGTVEKFYVMNRETGEISALMSENIKIDQTAPHFRNGEGITVSSDLLSSFGNTITFGIFFNDTKAVAISATDEESGLKSIEYCVSEEIVEADDVDGLSWKPYEDGFSISPEEYERAVIYAKITNHAGLVTYISSNGMIFDNKQPDINQVENGKEHSIIDEKEYITEEFNLKVSDRNLKQATLFEGTNTAVTGSALQVIGEEESTKTATMKISCPKSGSRTYTVVAGDAAGNNAEREFTITKPVYDIKADTLKIKSAQYGYETEPQVAVSWVNTEKANANATIKEIELSNNKDFEVKQTGNNFWIVAKQDLPHGNYATDVTLVYNGNKKVETTCSFTVDKAVLTATYLGDDLYYHEKIKTSSVKVTGFVKHKGVLETPETAAGYKEPQVPGNEIATETKELIPYGGKADNYKFVYQSGLLLVDRRYATTGKDGQYDIDGNSSNSGWYTSDIVIRPKEGFVLLSDEDEKELQESIELKEDTDSGEKSFYVMNVSTGEIYYRTTFYYKKDTVMPSIEGIEDKATYEANTKEVTVKDDALTSVTVNGEAMPVEQGQAKFTLTAEQETMVYVVVATDCAGNVNDMTIVMNQPETLPVVSDEPKEGNNDVPVPTATPITDDTDITSKAGNVKKFVKLVQGAPNTSLTTSTSDLKTSVLTVGEQQAVGDGSNANIELRIKNIDSSVPQEDKELVIANLSGYSVGEYLDITLWKKVGSSSEKKVTMTNKPISITVAVPENLQGGSRQFVVLRIHNGSVSVLPDRDSAANTVTFSSDKFSTYVLAYKQGSGSQTSGVRSAGSGGSSLYYDASPEMGDQAPLVPVVISFFTALAGLITVMIVRKRTK